MSNFTRHNLVDPREEVDPFQLKARKSKKQKTKGTVAPMSVNDAWISYLQDQEDLADQESPEYGRNL